jgi:uncharacterized 2Fe-2S/4Fe-4S cluster protein (DUF4445 family)
MAKKKETVTITFQPDGRKTTVPKGSTILDAAIEAGVGVEGPCGGQGTCGKCVVRLILGKGDELPEPNQLEGMALSSSRLDEGYRLACQVHVTKDCTVEVPKESKMYKHMILMAGLESATVGVPNVSVNTATNEEGEVTDTYVFLGEKVIAKRAGEHLEIHGVAVDLGTTTVVCHLVNLRSGSTMASTVALNPQVPRGDDVISRVKYAADPEGARWLTEKAREVVNSLIKEACAEAGVKLREVYEMVFAGNTCMHHLFFDLPVRSLGEAPYIPAEIGSLTVEAKKLGIKMSPKGQIYALPVLAGFLGADATAVALTAAMDCYEGTRLAIDIGTNGEVLLCTKGKIYGCSSPAGPAFEGAQISCGMRASTGAISYVRIEDGKVKTSVIGGGKPRGVTGSGLVEAVAELLRTGILDQSGRFVGEKGNKLIRRGKDGLEFVVVKKKATAHGKDIVITQKDIRQLQLAKAAIATGISILLGEAEITPEDIDDIFIAGAFGNYIDRESAMAIGLIPEMAPKKIVSIGNAAAIGAKRALVSITERARAEVIQRKLTYVELAGRKDFQEVYMSHIHF